MNDMYQNGWQPDPGSGDFRQAGSFTKQEASPLSLNDFIARTYVWMFFGLMVTFGVGLMIAGTRSLADALYRNYSTALVVVTIAEFAVVIAMSARLMKMSVTAARMCFLLYSALTGVTFSLYFVVFGSGLMMMAFALTALFFGGMAFMAHFFHLELGSIRNVLFGGLILLIGLSAVSLFIHLDGAVMAVNYLGIAIFLGYTAYDTSRMKDLYRAVSGNEELLAKSSIYSALQLYLDFINLFLRILSVLASSGNRKN